MTKRYRSHTLGALRKEHDGTEVSLSGWVMRRRDHGGLIFIDLRDRFGITQLVFDPTYNKEAHALAEDLRSEWVIAIKGKVRKRGEGLENPKLETGAIEVVVDSIEVLSKAKTPPFSLSEEGLDVHEDHRLKYRYLDLRRASLSKNFVVRHKVMQTVRRFLDSNGFLEISTPILGKSTPEGARDYLVPSRVHPGQFYALPQSPQIFKQLLMVGGMDRYFQIAQCFRDEDLRADRQPEFTQIDIEMSFSTPDELLPLMESMISNLFKEIRGLNLETPFRRLPHSECLERYGTDRPDLRFGMPLIRLDKIVANSSFSVFLEQLNQKGIVKGLCVKGGADLSRKEIEDYTNFVGRFGIKGLAWMKHQEEGLTSSITKFFDKDTLNHLSEALETKVGDLIFMIADEESKTNQALDHLRRKVAKDRNLIPQGRFEFLWVTDFPLFQWDAEARRVVSEHHPFTAPLPQDIHLLDSEPLKVRSNAYDLVLNGYEIGGGSQRIHDSELQYKIFELLKLTPKELEERFGFFIEALSYGTPPHLGLAFGLDRIVMILCETDNIRDVIAFPKTQKASDLMMRCPSQVSRNQLDELKIEISDPDFSWS